MKKLIELTKNWKHRNLLHIIGGGLISLLPNILAPKGLCFLISILLCSLIGHLWEIEQVKNYKAKYSIMDVILAIFGGIIISLIFKI